ncbi:hypothetical protein RND81_14G003000 [Saponaria officinalis]|uniref:Major facilitator superfamily (MFS) profile domain-containing protein n=1 Tax=Saponaria officinalis TaxID=3572 RepID=A0AAW1GGP4_SAPOF
METNASSRGEDIPASSILSVEETIEQSIGSINLTQILQIVLVSLPMFFDSQQTFISIFAHKQPAWHCTTNNASCTSKSNICNLPNTDWAWNSKNTHTSIMSEWDLECANSFYAGMPATSYFVGCFLGGVLLATLGDSSLGRKKLLCLTSLTMSLAAFASTFSPNIWVYSVFRFICGAGRAPVGVCVLILLTERVSKRWRSQAAMAAFTSFSLGILALTGIAFLTRGFSWRYLYLWTSIPGILCSVACYFFAFESPRWLYMQGRENDAVAVLRSLGSNTLISPNLPKAVNTEQQITKTNIFTSLKILVGKRWAVMRLLASMLLGFGNGLLYFGMFLGVGNLGFNIYLTSVFNALLSLVSYALTFLWWMQHCNRKPSLLGFCTISGATCIAMILGSVFDPIMILIGRKNIIYSYGIFGLTMLLCGFLVLCLPETRGKVLCDTMEEQELMDNNK